MDIQKEKERIIEELEKEVNFLNMQITQDMIEEASLEDLQEYLELMIQIRRKLNK